MDRSTGEIPGEPSRVLNLNPEQIAQHEARNALRQYDAAMTLASDALAMGGAGNFRLRPSHLCSLNGLAVEGLHQYAGVLRPIQVVINGSSHSPPPADKVPVLVEDMCDYCNEHAGDNPLHVPSYLMWRLNWVHPFADGNGRTARIVSYMMLCILSGYELPGTRTIPVQISDNQEIKHAYYTSLEAADSAFADDGRVDVSQMEELMGSLLAAQLYEFHQSIVNHPSD